LADKVRSVLVAATALIWSLTLSGRAQKVDHQLQVYDGTSGVGWANSWAPALWAPDDYAPGSDPLHSMNYAAPAPGRPGIAIEMVLGEPPDRPWAFTPINSGQQKFYLNQIKTVEFDVYFALDCTDAEALWFILNDVGGAEVEPLLVDLIPGWGTMTPTQRYGHWHHVTVDLASLNPSDPDVSRIVLYHLGTGLAHMAVSDVVLGWNEDLRPPHVTSVDTSFDSTRNELTVRFTTDEMTVYRVEYGVGGFSRHVQGDYHDWASSHTAVLPGLTPGATNDFRILLLDHQLDPATDANVGALTNSFVVPAGLPASPTPLPPANPQRYLAIYDSLGGGGWVNGWEPNYWAPDDYDPATDPNRSVEFGVPAPGAVGTAIELTLGEPPDRPWALTPINTGSTGYFLNEIRTLEFDVLFPLDASDPESLWFILNDASRADEPLLVDLIPGWFTLKRSERYGRWFHVVLDLAGLHSLDSSISRLVFYHYGNSPVHFFLANLRFGVEDRTSPPVITLVSRSLSLDYRQLTLNFTTDEATLYRVDYGVSSYGQTVQGPAADWSVSHAATLTGLIPGQTYQYRIVARDHRLDPAATPNQGVYQGTFIVPPVPTIPPVISGLGATDIAGSRATLVWSNERPCTVSISYHRSGVDSLTRSFGDFVLARACVLDLLEPSTAYDATVVVTDAFGLSSSQSLAFVTTAAGVPTVTITVNPAQTRPISPWIYGINFYEQIASAPPNLTLNRAGGNRWTAYNWENNASNAGLDWYFQSDDYLSPSSTPAEAIRSLIAGDRTRGMASLMTVQLQGYVAADKSGRVDMSDPNHIANRFRQVVYRKGAPFTANPVPGDANVYMDEFLWALRGQFPGDIFSDPATPTFVSLDNEPDLWFATHKEIQPVAVKPADFIQNTIALCQSLKDLDPSVQLFGPVNYGLYGMTTLQGAAGYDPNHWFVDDYLQALNAASAAAGRRLLDVYDFHWYSEARVGNTGVTALTGPNLTSDQIRAIVQSPRSLWDTNYSENSWIVGYLGGPIAILNRMQARIDAFWPGTKLAVTEYDNGGDNHIAGAIAQADNLGIFGSLGVFAANLWPMSNRLPFILGAFRMYRDFDGAKGCFGDVSLAAVSSATTNVAAYVSLDSQRPGRYVIVALNRSFVSQDVNFSGLSVSGTARVYRMAGTNTTPVFVGQVPAHLPSWVIALPPLSVSTIEITAPGFETAPTITAWPTAAMITRGQPLSSSTLTGGSASVPGHFAFEFPATEPLAGTNAHSVVFTPTNNAIYSSVTGSVRVAVNALPAAPDLNYTRSPNQQLKIQTSEVLAASTDPDLDTLSLAALGTGAQGATIYTNATCIIYSPGEGNNNADAFTYTVRDGRGGSAVGTIRVAVVAPAAGQVANITASGGEITLKFAGIPGFGYAVQRATDAGFTQNLTTLLATNTPPTGVFTVRDPSPPHPAGYYRLRVQ
jgi:hypothetical protein